LALLAVAVNLAGLSNDTEVVGLLSESFVRENAIDPVPVVPAVESFWGPHPSSIERKAMIIIVPNISGKRFNFLDI
jgi:hypothetical protein